MLRIEIRLEGQTTALYLSGRIQSEDIPALEKQLELLGTSLVFDLQELQLVDESAVRFLAACNSEGIVLRNCASYISEWIRIVRESK
jgi:anti-anti-sigma regulatory factor